MIGYTLNNFHYSYHNIIVDDGKFYNFKINKNEFIFKKIIIIRVINVETDLRLR
jgi:hypothetical protein